MKDLKKSGYSLATGTRRGTTLLPAKDVAVDDDDDCTKGSELGYCGRGAHVGAAAEAVSN